MNDTALSANLEAVMPSELSAPSASETPLAPGSNPYLEARREWNERYGDYITRARNWRIAALLSLVTCALLAAGLVKLLAQSWVVPYVVEVDRLGEISSVRPAEEAATPDERLIKRQLADFIQAARTVTADNVAMKGSLNFVYGMILPSTKYYLDDYYRQANPFKRAERELIAVDIEAVLPLSKDTYQIAWAETARDSQGRQSGETHWQANIMMVIQPPRTEADIIKKRNPFGIYVSSLTWTQKL